MGFPVQEVVTRTLAMPQTYESYSEITGEKRRECLSHIGLNPQTVQARQGIVGRVLDDSSTATVLQQYSIVHPLEHSVTPGPPLSSPLLFFPIYNGS